MLSPLMEKLQVPSAPAGSENAGTEPMRTRVVHGSVAGSALVGLATLAVAQPLLDLFGRSPEYFVANALDDAAIWRWALTVALVPALVAFALDLVAHALHSRLGRVVHRSMVFAFGAVVAMALLRPRDWAVDADTFFVAAVAGIVLWRFEQRRAVVRQVLRYLAPLPVLLLALFVFASPTGSLLRGGDPAAADFGARPDDVPVVLVVLDELPLSSLLNEDLQLDPEKFPNVARLASVSTWYRNAAAVSADTTRAVPAVLASSTPDEALLPIAADHPTSIFTLGAATHVAHSREAVTALCPRRVCGDRADQQTAAGADIWGDTSIVFRHLVLPRAMRENLPRIDRAWGGFALEGDSDGDDAGLDEGVLAGGRWSPSGEAAAARDWAESLPDEDPVMGVLHLLLPHAPWQSVPSGRFTGAGPRLGDATGRWLPDDGVRRHGLQRHLLQMGATDRLLGEVFDALEASGRWDDAIIVLVADHGANFGEGHQRSPSVASVEEVLRVPLLIHAPGQTEAIVDDAAVTTLDVLPTIAGLLGVDVSAAGLAGRDLNLAERAPPLRTLPGTQLPMPEGLDGLRRLVDRNAAMLGSGSGWDAVVGVGPAAGRLGDPLASVVTGDFSGDAPVLELDQVEQSGDRDVPGVLSGRLVGAVSGDDVLVAIDGRIAGAGVVLDGEEGTFVAVADERLWPAGTARVDVLVRAGGENDGWIVAQRR